MIRKAGLILIAWAIWLMVLLQSTSKNYDIGFQLSFWMMVGGASLYAYSSKEK